MQIRIVIIKLFQREAASTLYQKDQVNSEE